MHSIVTVVTPAASVDLTTLATLKAELGITTTGEDTQLGTWIGQASAACEAYCNRTFARETLRETFRNPSLGARFASIPLKKYPVTAIASVVEDGVTLTVDTQYEVSDNGLLYRLDAQADISTWQFSKLVVTYTAGYVLVGDLPRNIERACLSLAKVLRSSSTRDSLVKTESIPGVLDTTYWVGGMPGSVGNMPPDVAALLDPFKEVSV